MSALMRLGRAGLHSIPLDCWGHGRGHAFALVVLLGSGAVAVHRLAAGSPRVRLALLAGSAALVAHHQILHVAWFGA